MRVTVRFSGPIRRPWPEESRTLEVEAASTVASVLRGLGYARRELRFLLTAVGGESAGLKAELADGDCLEVMLRVGGG